jgi:undecaprenyl-phosphate 4-deoxy-4-formamido-L-arabinose transferase
MLMTKGPTISVVVPVYRSEQSLEELVDRTVATLTPICAAFEIVLVNDGSPDDSWAKVCELAERHENVTGVSLSRNFGQHNALLAGVRRARYELIVTMDDDLEHLPEQIPVLLAQLDDKHDLVYGFPERENRSVARNFLSRATKLTLGASLGSDVAAHISAFRAFRSRLREGFALVEDPFLSLDVLLSWTTDRAVAVPVEMDVRRYGASNYTSSRLVRYALDLITGFSTLPLRLVTYVGFGFAAFGVLVLIYVIGRYVLQGFQSVPGFPFIASLVAILSGAQLFALGIIGEYIGRMHYRSMRQPVYLVSATTDDARRIDSEDGDGGDGAGS